MNLFRLLAGLGTLLAASVALAAPRPGIELAKNADLGASGRSFALIIGISAYQHLPPKAQLQLADKDAQAFKEFLTGPTGGFLAENVTLLVNRDATRENILRQLERLQNRSGLNDMVLVFFAGHGVVNAAGQGFLLASDSRPNDLLVSAVPMNTFNDFMSRVRARSVLVISDACHSGALGDLFIDSGAVTSLSARAFTGPGRFQQSSFIFSAASPSQSSIEDAALGHGLFTYHILQGLGGAADKDGDGLVRAKELYDYVSFHVRDDAAKLQQDQVPEFNANYDRSIPLAILNEAGLALYRAWFDTDPIVSSVVSRLDEALSASRLTKPAEDCAYSYFMYLSTYPGPDPEALKALVQQKREDLLRHLDEAARRVMDRSPLDPAPWEEAREYLEKGYDLSRDDSRQALAYLCSAMVRYHSGEIAPAARACENALRLVEERKLNLPALCLRIARFFREQAQWPESSRAYRLAVAAAPDAAALNEYGEVLLQIGDLPGADAQLRRSRELAPENTRTLRLLAEVLLRSARPADTREAVAIATQARGLQPGDPELDYLLGRSLLQAGEPARAILPLRAVAEKWLDDTARRDPVLSCLSQAYAGSGDPQRAVSALREAERRGSQAVYVYGALGEQLYQLGDLANAVAAARRAAELVPAGAAEKSPRLRQVAEYLERRGDLVEAAFTFRDAARLAADSRLATALERHAAVLFMRAGRPQDAGGISRVTTAADQGYIYGRRQPSPVTVHGGCEALARLTGVRLGAVSEDQALALVFDACLQRSDVYTNLRTYLDRYGEFEKKIVRKAIGRGSLTVPAPNQPHTELVNDLLEFLDVRDKNGRREVRDDFTARQVFVTAFGGDPLQIRQGEPVVLTFRNDQQLPVFLGIQEWMGRVKDGAKAEAREELLFFLNDRPAMELYVGLSMLPERTARWFFGQIAVPDNIEELPAGIRFAAPYLRLSAQGQFYVPGQRLGEQNWQNALDARSPIECFQKLFKARYGGALYLFAALSAAGPVGDWIGASGAFPALFNTVKDSPLPASRSGFDLMDLFDLLRVEGDQLRLRSPAAERGLNLSARGGVLAAIMAGCGQSAPGAPIPLARKIALLTLLERERPDWVLDPASLALLCERIGAGQEHLLEPALDLPLPAAALPPYFGRVKELGAVAAPTLKIVNSRAFQAALELLCLLARRGALPAGKPAELAEKLLALEPGREEYALATLALLRGDLLGLDATAPGPTVEQGLLSLLAGRRIVRLPAGAPASAAPAPDAGPAAPPAPGLEFDTGEDEFNRMTRVLTGQRHNRLAAAADAMAAVEQLELNPADPAALARLQAAAGSFVDREPAPAPDKKKKKKGKEVVERPLNPAALAAALTLPASPAALKELRAALGPAAGEALLGAVYAALLAPAGDDSADPNLVHAHDFSGNPWGRAQFDRSSRTMRNGVFGLASAVSQAAAGTADFAGAAGGGSLSMTDYLAACGDGFALVDERWVSDPALEGAARTLDLGEDALALYSRGDQTAVQALAQLETILLPRRAEAMRDLLDNAETARAVDSLTLSERFYLGRLYFQLKLAETPATELVPEPGALGALTRLLSPGAGPGTPAVFPEPVERGVWQFGMPVRTRRGLDRLDLASLEPYERCAAFSDGRRMAERIQDFKLALGRSCFRRGGPAALCLNAPGAREILRRALAAARAATGGMLPPGKDWPDIVSMVQSAGGSGFEHLVSALASAPAARPRPETSWRDAPNP